MVLSVKEKGRASSLVEAPNIDTKPKIEDLVILFEKIADTKERNENYTPNYTPAVQSPLFPFLITIEIADLDNPR